MEEITAEQIYDINGQEFANQDDGSNLETVEGDMPEAEKLKEEA